jgi:hypothetical protein
LKYDKQAFKIDSVKFTNELAQWEMKFTNPKIDTGFISISGIYRVVGKEKPVLFNPDKAQEILKMFITVNKDAKPGTYFFELTTDPIQNSAFLSSTDGINGWQPVFVPGKIVVKK